MHLRHFFFASVPPKVWDGKPTGRRANLPRLRGFPFASRRARTAIQPSNKRPFTEPYEPPQGLPTRYMGLASLRGVNFCTLPVLTSAV